MHILVTGGTGYIGSHLVVELLQQDYRVSIIDNLSNSDKSVLQTIQLLTDKTPTFYQTDVGDKNTLRAIFAKEPIDAVIHLAGYKSVNESLSNPISYYQNNVQSTVTLLDVMNEFNVKTFVFSSSATVYGVDNPSPLVETASLNPNNPYGRSKWMCEQILNDLSASDSDWSIAILRYFNPAGAHISGLLSEQPLGLPTNIMPVLTQVATGQKPRFYIFGADYDTIDSTAIRDYIHVSDLVTGHVSALKKVLSQPGLHTYNLGSGQGTSVLNLVWVFEAVTGLVIPYQLADRREGDVPVSVANSDKALRELGWSTKRSIADICRDTWRSQQYKQK